MHKLKTQSLLIGVTLMTSLQGLAADAPLYKPSSRSAEAIDISSNAYGGSALAPTALNIADVAPDFSLKVSGGGTYTLNESATKKPVAVVFYRGHW